jgi:hypothetical protein
MKKFKIGDKVKLILLVGANGLAKNSTGTIVGFGASGSDVVCVSWDNWTRGHSGTGYRKISISKEKTLLSCWNVNENSIVIFNAQMEFNFDA